MFQFGGMTQPLALVFYEKLLPGSRLVNLLQDMHYRVQTVTKPELLVGCAQQEKPLLIFVDMISDRGSVNSAITTLKQQPATQHIPVIAFIAANATDLQKAALVAGATLVVAETAVLGQLNQIIEQALHVN